MNTRLSTFNHEDDLRFNIAESGDDDQVLAWIDIESSAASWTVFVDETEHDSTLAAVRARLLMFAENIEECLEQLFELERANANQCALDLEVSE